MRDITETLARELADPTATAPRWSQTQWALACAVAAIHGVSPLLAERLRWQGPQRWQAFLTAQRTQTVARCHRIQGLLDDIDAGARRDGVALVALKGAALHARGVYVAGQRPMSDIDLLVQEAQFEGAAGVLERLGFRETYRTWKHRVFGRDGEHEPAALGEHAANAIRIELHPRIREILPVRAVDLSSVVWPRSPQPGLNPHSSQAALLMHLLLHAAGVAVMRELRLLHLHDIARLSERMSEEDWEELLRHAATAADAGLWWAYPPFALVRRYFNCCVPDHVMARAESGCHWTLRRAYRSRTLAKTSLSHLWVTAFPGIEWARSAGELLRYAAARVAPSAETLAMRKVMAAEQPRVSGGAWAQLSQGRRMVRWAVAAQALTSTLQPVRAALRGCG